jgi:hypothetical protein
LGIPRGGSLQIPIVGLSRGGNDSPFLDEVKSVWVSPLGGVTLPLGRGKIRLGIPLGWSHSPFGMRLNQFGYPPGGESLSLYWDRGIPYKFRVWGLGFWVLGF